MNLTPAMALEQLVVDLIYQCRSQITVRDAGFENISIVRVGFYKTKTEDIIPVFQWL